jgi:hypothetical protein
MAKDRESEQQPQAPPASKRRRYGEEMKRKLELRKRNVFATSKRGGPGRKEG